MNIKRIGLIGGNYSPNSGDNTTGDSLWEISSTDRLQHTRKNNAEVSIGTHIIVAQTDMGNRDRICIDVDSGIQIDRNNTGVLAISPHVCIGTDSIKNPNVFIGTGVYIERGFDSRNISGSGSGDGLWKLQNNMLISEGGDRFITLGTRVSIGVDNYVELGENGIVVSNTSSSKVRIGSEVIICKEQGEALTIGSGGILVYNNYDNRPIVSINDKVNIGYDVTLGDNVFIQKNFNTQRYIDSNNDLIPACIPTDSSLNTSRQLSVNIIPQSNGNIKIGDTLFMPATPSGDPMHYAYITAGAEYNDTDSIIQKTAPWSTNEKWKKNEDGTYTHWEEPAIVDHLPKHWYLNGLGDINNEEMQTIYENGRLNVGNDMSNFYTTTARTTLPCRKSGGEGTPFDFYYLIGYRSNIVNLCLTTASSAYVSIIHAMLGHYVEHVYPQIIMSTTNAANISKAFDMAINLLECTLTNLKLSISYANSPNIYKRCILNVIQNAIPTSAITITLHADSYARLVNDADIVAALETKNAALEGTGGSISLVSA